MTKREFEQKLLLLMISRIDADIVSIDNVRVMAQASRVATSAVEEVDPEFFDRHVAKAKGKS